jgi:CheY-like chemotaxis protein
MEVADTQALLAHLNENCPTAVLLDWELPGLHNSDYLRIVRASCPQTKVIAMSSKFEARQQALASRVDAFVSKSEPPERILSTLCSLIPQLRNE